MEGSGAMFWWVAAGVLVAAELATGTFLLLMLALGCVAGALAAHLGLGLSLQITAGALVSAIATAAWHFKRASRPRSAPVEMNADANLDIGQIVKVATWAADGTARAPYRGASWALRFEGEGTPAPGDHVIVAMRGNELGVAPVPPRR